MYKWRIQKTMKMQGMSSVEKALLLVKRELRLKKLEELGAPAYPILNELELINEAKALIEADPVANELVPKAREYQIVINKRQKILEEETSIISLLHGFEDISQEVEGNIEEAKKTFTDPKTRNELKIINQLSKKLKKEDRAKLIETLMLMIIQIKHEVCEQLSLPELPLFP